MTFIPADDDPSPGDMAAREREMAAIRGLASAYTRLRGEIGKVVIGQADVVDQLLIAMFCRAHCLLMGVPGLAKTLLVSTVAKILRLSFRRIQFTPDLNRGAGCSSSCKVRFLPTSCSPTKSTVRRPRLRRHCWKRCRNDM
jgi:hypothetical protein